MTLIGVERDDAATGGADHFLHGAAASQGDGIEAVRAVQSDGGTARRPRRGLKTGEQLFAIQGEALQVMTESKVGFPPATLFVFRGDEVEDRLTITSQHG